MYLPYPNKLSGVHNSLKNQLNFYFKPSRDLQNTLRTLLTHRINPDRLLHIILPPYFLFLEPFDRSAPVRHSDGMTRRVLGIN